eukprot:SAG31_NODE_3878_length_3791_cov_2.674702_4_plen_54_part_00
MAVRRTHSGAGAVPVDKKELELNSTMIAVTKPDCNEHEQPAASYVPTHRSSIL